MRKLVEPASYPLPECVVQPGTSATIFTSLPSANWAFRPTWFAISEEIARPLLVNDVKVGRNSQLVCCASVPASLFSGPAGSLRMNTCPRGIELTLSVTNTSQRSARFAGRVLGSHGDDPPAERRGQLLCGLGHSLVPPGIFNLRVQPQVEIEPARLFLPGSILRDFVVEEVAMRPYRHGYQTQDGVFHSSDVPASASVPAAMLSPESLRGTGKIRLVPAGKVEGSSFLCLRLVNRARAARWFEGAILG